MTNVTLLDTPQAAGELWSRGFLGETANLLYAHLSPTTPIEERTLMQLTGKSRNTVKSGLAKLFRWGLSQPAGNRQWLRGPANLKEVSDELGTPERARERRAKHREEREAYKKRKLALVKNKASKTDEHK